VTDSGQQQIAARRPRRRRTILEIALTALALTLGAVFAAIALASSPATVGSASSTTLGERVLVNAKGRTLYVLTPETARHLLCTSSECLKFWPPLTVPSRGTKLVRDAGVHGRLGILQRKNGILQVTLNGLPLYRFAEDKADGEVNGQNFKGFGGIWHVLGVSGTPSSAAPVSASNPATSTPTTSTPTMTTPTTTTPTTSTPTTTTPTSTTPGYTY
jgi:predicted lipoprotein with Yx(FWY)xxD motif